LEQAKYRAYICCGPNCGPKDSRALLDFLEEEVARAGLSVEVTVSPTGCQSHCDSGPTMVVYPGPVYYQEIDRQRLQRIVVEHFQHDRPVEAYFWRGPRKRVYPDGTTRPVAPNAPLWYAKQESARGYVPKLPPKRKIEDVDDFKW
jgi:(2Fe-2S) ferredoxin